MKNKIGFAAFDDDHKDSGKAEQKVPISNTPKKSLVDVYFPDDGRTLTYFNDLFDLKEGNIVFVDGKLEGIPGRVRSIQYNFKIKPDDYKKVLSVADNEVHGELYLAGSHYVTFDADVIPYEKIKSWFFPPQEEYLTSTDDEAFGINDFEHMPFSGKTMERGHDYYMRNRVAYVSVNGEKGNAVVLGTHPYEVEFELIDYAEEFELTDGMISRLTCTCPCASNCKHQFAAILQLKETLNMIAENYQEQYQKSNYFAAVEKQAMEAYVLSNQMVGKMLL